MNAETGTLITAVAATGISLGALAVAIHSAASGKSSAQSAKVAAEAAELSAAAAAKSAEADGAVARVELDRDHEAYRPPQPVDPQFHIEVNPRTGRQGLFLTFTPPRSYRIHGKAIEGASRGLLSLPRLVYPAGGEVRVYVQDLRPVREVASIETLWFRFWPPANVDEGVEHWTCHCGRPVDSADFHDDKPGHWEWRIRVTTPEGPPLSVAESLG